MGLSVATGVRCHTGGTGMIIPLFGAIFSFIGPDTAAVDPRDYSDFPALTRLNRCSVALRVVLAPAASYCWPGCTRNTLRERSGFRTT